MKRNLVMALMLASALSSGFSASGKVSTLAERADLIKSAGSDKDKIIEIINKKQQEGDIKVDDANYIVVLKKKGDAYERVAHSKKEKIGHNVGDNANEAVLLEAVKDAETKLNGGDGPVSIQFNADGPKFAVVLRFGDLLVFNICADESQVKNLLDNNKPDEKKPEEKKPEVKPEEKKVEIKTDDSKEKAADKTDEVKPNNDEADKDKEKDKG